MAEPDPEAELDDDVADLLRPRPHERALRVLDRWRADPVELRPLSVVIVVVVVVVAAGALWWLLRPAPPPVEATIPRAAAATGADAGSAGTAAAGDPAVIPGGAAAGPGATEAAGPGAAVVVQAAGAVVRPGVYRMEAGQRVDDLVRRAGGLTPDADVDRVNLAAPLSDGERVWIPRRGEAAPPPVVAGAGGGGGTTPGGPSGGAGGGGPAAVVDLNTATAEQLDALPGVGPATATAILAYRDANGPFRSVDDLLEVRGIGEAKLEQLRPLVRV